MGTQNANTTYSILGCQPDRHGIDIAFVLAVMAFNILVARFGMWPYSLVTFPGNAGHELMHWFVAKLLFAQPAFPSLWPRRDGDRWIMGSVAFAPSIVSED